MISNATNMFMKYFVKVISWIRPYVTMPRYGRMRS